MDLFKTKTKETEERKTGLWSNPNYANAKDRYDKGIKNAYQKNTIKKITTAYTYNEYVMAMFILEKLRTLDNLNTSETILKLLLDESNRRNLNVEIPKEFEITEIVQDEELEGEE